MIAVSQNLGGMRGRKKECGKDSYVSARAFPNESVEKPEHGEESKRGVGV